MSWTEKLVTIWGNISFSSLHGFLNGYGKAVVIVGFQTSQYHRQITEAVQAIGWQIITDSWDSRHELGLYRTGPALVGKRDELVRELTVALAPIPNPILLLHPDVSRNDYSRLPKWTINRSSNPRGEAMTPPQTVFGKKPDTILPSPKRIKPANAAAKALTGAKPWSRTADEEKRSSMGWFRVAFLSSLGVGWLSSVFVQLNEHALSIARNIPLVGVLYWSGDQLAFGLYLWPLCLTAGLAIALVVLGSITVVGQKVVHCLRHRDTKKHLSQDPEHEASIGPDESEPKDLPRSPWTLPTGIIWVGGCLYAVGVGFSGPKYVAFAQDISKSSPDFFRFAIFATVTWAGAGVVIGLWSAARKMSPRRGRRFVLSLGALIGAGAIILRAPAWAYADGLGAPWLWDSFDWTSLLSLSTQFAMYLGICGGLTGFTLWYLRIVPKSFRSLVGFPVLAILLFQGFFALEPAWEQGYALVETGSAQHARGDYPIAACLHPAHAIPKNEPSPIVTAPTAVWILASKDGRLVITDRAQGTDSLSHTGQIQSLPAADYALQIVRTPDDPKERCP